MAAPGNRGDPELVRRTRRWELVRGLCVGPVGDSAKGSGLLLLVAVSHFDAPDGVKSLIAAAPHAGLVLTTAAVTVAARRGWRVARATALAYLAAAAGLAIAAFGGGLGWYALGVAVGSPFLSLAFPFITTVWRQNAPDAVRGRAFATVMWASRISAIVGALLIAWWMRDDAGRYRLPLAALTVLLFGAAFGAARVPSAPLERAGRNPLAALAWLGRDRAFGYMSLVWMLFGLANHLTMPLRVELAAARDHLALAPAVVLGVTVILPQAMQLLSMMWWGRLFDRLNFVALRMVLNACFGASIACFFLPAVVPLPAGLVLPALVAGGLLFGLGQGGGAIAWNLWVTKYAAPQRTADYMSCHTFLTGLRGVVGPVLAFQLAPLLGISAIASVSFVAIVCSILMLVPVLRLGGRASTAPPAEGSPSE